MRKIVLVVPFMMLSLGVSTVWADAVSGQQQNKVTQIRSIADIDRKIKEAESYLEKLPVQLDETKEKFKKLSAMGNKVEEDISSILKYMDECSTHELKYNGASMCDSIINASIDGKGFQEILNGKRKKIQNAINFITDEIETLQNKMKETKITKDGIKVLKRMKSILLYEEQ